MLPSNKARSSDAPDLQSGKYVVQIQTVVTAYMNSKKLMMYAFTRQNCNNL